MTCESVMRTVNSHPDKQGELAVNLSDRLEKAAQDRRKQYEAARRSHATTVGSYTPESSIEFDSVASFLPEPAADPIDASQLEPMKMRLPEAMNETVLETGPLPIWERPLADLLRDAPLATVTSLPIVPHVDIDDDDLDDVELAQPIPMRVDWAPSAIDVDLEELHVPPLTAAESRGLADVALRHEHEHEHRHTEHDDVIDLDDIDLDDIAIDAELVTDDMVIDLDEVTVDAEIVEIASADALLDRWSAGVSAYAQDQQEKVDGLYQRMVDAAQRPRITSTSSSTTKTPRSR